MQQMGMKQASKAVASHGAFAHLATYDNRTTPWREAAIPVRWGEQIGLGLEQPQDHQLSVEATPLPIKPIKGPLPPQPMPLWQGHCPRPA